MKKKILLLSVLLMATVFSFGCRKAPQKQVTLTYYKLFDEEDVLRPAIEAYQKRYPNVKIRYRKFVDPEAYEDLILNELAEGEGPDIFEVSNRSLPRFLKKISPLLNEGYPPEQLGSDFVSVVAEDFVREDPNDGKKKIYGIPLSIDTPVLYYNRDFFEKKLPEKGKPSETWDGLLQDVVTLREEDVTEGIAPEVKTSTLKRGGIALGRADNIQLAPDIFLNLMLQRGVPFYNNDFTEVRLSSGEAIKAFEFFLSFSDPTKKQFSWNETMADSKAGFPEGEAFLSGKVAMIIGYSDFLANADVFLKNVRAKLLGGIAASDIGVVPFPQESGNLEEKVISPKYYVQTVSRTSKNAFAAWDFISFLTSRAEARKYLEKTKKPAARRDLIEDQKQDPALSVFVSQLGYAKTIPMAHEMRYEEFLREAIEKVRKGETNPQKALAEAETEMNALIPKERGLFPKYTGKRRR